MTSSEYQNKIISLLDDLANVFGDIARALSRLISNDLSQKAFNKSRLNENEIEDLKQDLKLLIEDLWQCIDRLQSAINTTIAFENTNDVSDTILDVIGNARTAWNKYTKAEKGGLLDNEIVSNKRSVLTSLEDLAKKITEYNKKFSPNLKTMNELLVEDEKLNKEATVQLYEEVFHKKFPGIKYQKKEIQNMSKILKAKKKPVVIECMLYNDIYDVDDLESWVGEKLYTEHQDVFISTLEGDMRVNPGDWVIKGVHGEFYPCKPDIFTKTYELI